MTQELNDSYVRKDLHDKDHELLAAEINTLKSRLDDVKDFVSWGVAILGVGFAIIQVGVGVIVT